MSLPGEPPCGGLELLLQTPSGRAEMGTGTGYGIRNTDSPGHPADGARILYPVSRIPESEPRGSGAKNDIDPAPTPSKAPALFSRRDNPSPMECRTGTLVRKELQLRYTELVDPDLKLYPTVPADLPEERTRILSRVLEKMEAFAAVEEAGGGARGGGLVLPGSLELVRDPRDFDARAVLTSADHCGIYRVTDAGRGIAVKYRVLRLLARRRVRARVRQVLSNLKHEKLICVTVGTEDNGVDDVQPPMEIPGHVLIDARARTALAQPQLAEALRRWVAAADQTGRVDDGEETVEVVVDEVDMMAGAVLFSFAHGDDDDGDDDDLADIADIAELDDDPAGDASPPQVRQLEIADVGDDFDGDDAEAEDDADEDGEVAESDADADADADDADAADDDEDDEDEDDDEDAKDD